MNSVDYESINKSSLRLGGGSRIFRVISVAVLGMILLASLLITYSIYGTRMAIRKFDKVTDRSLLIGKTVRQTITMLGIPRADSRLEGGTGSHADSDINCVIGYEDQSGETCRIEFSNGIATDVQHFMK